MGGSKNNPVPMSAPCMPCDAHGSTGCRSLGTTRATAREAPQLRLSSGTDFQLAANSLRAPTYLHLVLDPGPDGVGLSSKLAAQALVGMLAGQLLLQGLIPDGHELLHLSGPKGNRG